MQQQRSELYELLTHAFEGWGSRAYFEWKYDRYPNYDPSTDDLTITNAEGRIVAARRVFRHRMQTPAGASLSVHIHGGTAVHEAYRGRGYYTRLLEESMRLSRREADVILTFNRDGKITTKHHEKNGWKWLRLPVFVSIISPSRLVSYYMTSSDTIKKATHKFSVIDRKLTDNPIVSHSMATLVSRLYADSERTRQDTSPIGAAIKPRKPSFNGDDGDSVADYDIHRIDGSVSETVVDELHSTLQKELPDSYYFERTTEKLKHCLSYPESAVFVAREADTERLLDFVIVGTLMKGALSECRVLEATWRYPAVTRQLFSAVDSYGRETGVDVIVACSRRQPGPHWAPLDTEYMMWPPETASCELPTDPDDWRITMYDIL